MIMIIKIALLLFESGCFGCPKTTIIIIIMMMMMMMMMMTVTMAMMLIEEGEQVQGEG